MEIYTIGFTKTSAAKFFGRLRSAGVRRLVDVRLNNSSQLAAFAKRDDLEFFLRELCGAEYIHETLLAPTQEMLDAYKKQKGDWAEYERRYLDLLNQRRVELALGKELFDGPTALLCSEAEARFCHRRLAIEYLKEFWREIEARHL